MVYSLFIISLLISLVLTCLKFYYEFSLGKSKTASKTFGLKTLVGKYFRAQPIRPHTNKKQLESRLAIAKGILHFITAFCFVAFVFSIFQYWLDHTADILFAQATILKIEQAQLRTKNFVEHFKVSWYVDVIALLLLVALATSFPIIEKYKMKEKFKKGTKVVAAVLFLLTISTSFTFFGNELSKAEEDKEAKLEIHKLKIIEGNKLLAKKIRGRIEEQVANEILSNPAIINVLSDIDKVLQNIQAVKDEDELRSALPSLPVALRTSLSLTKFETTITPKYCFSEALDKVATAFENTYRPNYPQITPDYEGIEQVKYEDLKERSKGWFDLKNISESSVREANAAFTEAAENSPIISSAFYEKYKEPIEKLVKKGYESTFKKMLKSAIEAVGLDFPFMEEFLDPIFNDKVEEFITSKTESLFKTALEGNSVALNKGLNNCAVEFKGNFNDVVGTSVKFNSLVNNVNNDIMQSKLLITLTREELQPYLMAVDNFMDEISQQSRWESIRESFYNRLLDEADLEIFTHEQRDVYKRMFADWEGYKKSNKFGSYARNAKDLEELFYDFSRNNASAKACWGFILQQQDWDGAVGYYTLHPDPNAMGKPYYLLKYYYNSTNKGEQFEAMYDNATNAQVGGLCPPH